jgi:hypothetical protein
MRDQTRRMPASIRGTTPARQGDAVERERATFVANLLRTMHEDLQHGRPRTADG